MPARVANRCWDHDRFFYNRSVNNVNVTNIHNVYNTTVINNRTVNRISYNGGNGGIDARPTREEEAAQRERHIPPVGAQTQHLEAARANPELRASANHGRPPVAATPRPAAFHDRGVVPAKEAGAPYHPEANRAAEQPHGNPSVPRPGNSVPRSPLRFTQRILQLIHALLLQTRETRDSTRNTNNSRKSCTRSSNRSTKDSSRNRSRTTSGWRNSRPMKREISRWNKGTNNRLSNWSKDTSSSSSTCGKTATGEPKSAHASEVEPAATELPTAYFGGRTNGEQGLSCSLDRLLIRRPCSGALNFQPCWGIRLRFGSRFEQTW
jgi:hypothetical protein